MSEHALFSPRFMFVSSAVMLIASGIMQLCSTWSSLQLTRVGSDASHPDASVDGRVPELSPLQHEYSWLGDDHPPTLPLDLPFVALTLENSRHYSLNDANADAEFQSIYPGKSLGFVHLGPERRFFGLSMYHQIHCLDSLRLAVLGVRPHGEHRLGQSGNAHWEMDHVHHCLNYLRQTILCAADLTLEPEVEEGSDDAGEGLGVTHVCKDWSIAYQYVEKNFDEWERWKSNRTGSSMAT